MNRVAKIKNLIITTELINETRIYTIIDEDNKYKVIADMIETFEKAIIKANEYLNLIEYIKPKHSIVYISKNSFQIQTL